MGKDALRTESDSPMHVRLQAFLQGEGQGEAVGQLVRGGLHEVDMLRRRMRCVYWPEHAHRISRGSWFVEKAPDWVPLKVCPPTPAHLLCAWSYRVCCLRRLMAQICTG